MGFHYLLFLMFIEYYRLFEFLSEELFNEELLIEATLKIEILEVINEIIKNIEFENQHEKINSNKIIINFLEI